MCYPNKIVSFLVDSVYGTTEWTESRDTKGFSPRARVMCVLLQLLSIQHGRSVVPHWKNVEITRNKIVYFMHISLLAAKNKKIQEFPCWEDFVSCGKWERQERGRWAQKQQTESEKKILNIFHQNMKWIKHQTWLNWKFVGRSSVSTVVFLHLIIETGQKNHNAENVNRWEFLTNCTGLGWLLP